MGVCERFFSCLTQSLLSSGGKSGCTHCLKSWILPRGRELQMKFPILKLPSEDLLSAQAVGFVLGTREEEYTDDLSSCFVETDIILLSLCFFLFDFFGCGLVNVWRHLAACQRINYPHNSVIGSRSPHSEIHETKEDAEQWISSHPRY